MNHRSGLRVVEKRSRLPTDALRALGHRVDGYRKSVDLGEGWEQGAREALAACRAGARELARRARARVSRRVARPIVCRP